MTAPSWLDENFIARLEALTLRVRRAFQGSSLGRRRARELGSSGGEFAEHLPYAGIEDYRHIDWNAYARSNTLVIKRFDQDRDVTVDILIDTSASMNLGNPRKLDHARKLAAAVSYVALADLDRLGLTSINLEQALATSFPRTQGKGQILNVLSYLDSLESNGQTQLSKGIDLLLSRPQRLGLVLLFSDWYDPDGFQPALDRLRHRGLEIHVIQVYSPEEAVPAELGELELYETEWQERRKVIVTAAIRDRYTQAFKRYQNELMYYCHKHGMGYTEASTAESAEETAFRILRDRMLVR